MKLNWVHRCRFAGAVLVVLLFGIAPAMRAQTPDDLGDGSVDPIKLFERGQNAHARGDLPAALEFYEAAIKLRPEFPEAEYQRGVALVALGRPADAETGFRRAIELRKNWAPPYVSLGMLLAHSKRDRDAELVLNEGLKLDSQNSMALRALAEIRLRAGDAPHAVEFARRATNDKAAPASAWVLLGLAQHAAGDKTAAREAIDHALQIDGQNVAALEERADLSVEDGDYEHAIGYLKTAADGNPGDRQILVRLLGVYLRAGKSEEAARLAQQLGLGDQTSQRNGAGEIKVEGTPEQIEAANSSDPDTARRALEALVVKNPRNAMLLGKLGGLYRTTNPEHSLELYRQANALEPKNPDYAIGYAAALIQARRFEDAATILQRVVAAVPDNYTAHANLATALYELKRFKEAIPEYDWLIKAKPDRVVIYFFIATAHDKLGEFEDALTAYEAFLAKADPKANQLEIEKVNLRLPSLRKQIKLGQGVKRHPDI